MELCPVCQSPLAAPGQACTVCGAAPVTLPVGTKLAGGRYSIGRVLGQGGFGITYQGADTMLRRAVAIKEYFPEGSARRGASLIPPAGTQPQAFAQNKERFLEEARTLAQFTHPGIVRVLDVFEENATAYMVMEFLTGETLGHRLNKRGPLPAQEAFELARRSAEALEVVHKADLLHRDLKPDNIYLTADGRVLLIDFGAARRYVAGHTVRHTQILTPGYAPLEQYQSDARFGPPTDLYALGATLYHAVVGEPPPTSLDRVQDPALPPLPDLVPPGLRAAIEKSLALRPAGRPQSVAEFLALLEGRPMPVPRSNSGGLQNGGQGPQPMPGPNSGWSPMRNSVPIRNFTVAPDGTGDVATLEEALRQAQQGSTIYLRKGRYVLSACQSLDRAIAVVGEGATETAIVTAASDTAIFFVTGAASVFFRNLTIRREGGQGYLLVQDGGELNLTGCTLEGAVGKPEGTDALLVGKMARAKVTGCQIQRNEIGIGAYEQAQVEVSGCTIRTNETGIRAQAGARLSVVNSNCSDNVAGLHAEGAAFLTVQNTIFNSNTENGISVGGQVSANLVGNTSSENNRHGIGYFSLAPGVLEQNTCTDNMGAGIAIGRGAQPMLRNNICNGNRGGEVRRF